MGIIEQNAHLNRHSHVIDPSTLQSESRRHIPLDGVSTSSVSVAPMSVGCEVTTSTDGTSVGLGPGDSDSSLRSGTIPGFMLGLANPGSFMLGLVNPPGFMLGLVTNPGIDMDIDMDIDIDISSMSLSSSVGERMLGFGIPPMTTTLTAGTSCIDIEIEIDISSNLGVMWIFLKLETRDRSGTASSRRFVDDCCERVFTSLARKPSCADDEAMVLNMTTIERMDLIMKNRNRF